MRSPTKQRGIFNPSVEHGGRGEYRTTAGISKNHRDQRSVGQIGGEIGLNEPTNLIHNIRLTEKASLLGEKNNQYVFRVDPRANKLQIKQAIQKLFGKKVVRVNTAQYAGKKKRERRADFGRRAHWKKAIVTLAEGEKIDLV